ncbi:MAG TPA: hypothetical protein VK190_03575 [Pseudoneobacillus sp.]|nr:hypothetical protein [Pseudoneobacillus sp.]
MAILMVILFIIVALIIGYITWQIEDPCDAEDVFKVLAVAMFGSLLFVLLLKFVSYVFSK